jgi:hypothetical protein
MVFGNRGARSSGTKQRKSEAFQPRGEALEQKILLTLLQLGAGTPVNIAGSMTTAPAGPQTIAGQLPFIADSSGLTQVQGTQTTDPGLGVLETGNVASQGAGYSVAALGDMNLDGSNDYLIGAPGVTQSGSVISPQPVTGTTMSQAFLIFGNRSTTIPSIQSWLSSTPEQRVGVLTSAGQPATSTTPQFNPFTARGQPYNYDFDGVSFITSMDPNSGLGAFVAAAGPNAFVIGAPNYTTGAAGAAVGRLYYITATSNFNVASLRSAPIDLDSPQNYPGLTIVTFVQSLTLTSGGRGLGSSFAYVPNLLGDGSPDLVIGESGASLNGKTGNGGVFVFEPSSLPNTAGASNIVSVQAQSQFTFAGANSGDAAGSSVASAGDVNGAPGGVNDLLIGAPNFRSNAGAAYLVYGGTTLTSGKLTNPSTGFLGVDLSRLEITPTTADPTPPQGAVFVGAGTDMAGYTVSSASDFNPAVSSLDDFMIGSPGGNGQAGRVNLFYGASTTMNSTGQFTTGLIANATNPIALNNPTAPLALTGVAPISASFVGASAGDRAAFSLSYINAGTSTTSTPPSPASIILIGAPGNVTAPRGSGSVYELLGPTTGTYTTQLQPLNSTIARQYTLSFPTTGPNSSNPIGFGTSVSAFATGNGDFIAGGPGYTGTLASASVPPVPLPTPNNTLLVGAGAMVLNTLQPANSLIPLGTVPPTPPTPPGPVAGAVLPGTFVPTNYIPPYMFVPTDSALSALNYAPIPLKVALQQYLPPDGFIQRDYAYNHPGKKLPPTLEERGQTQSRKTYGSSGVWTLGSKVFTRGRFHPGKTYQWTHTSPHNGTQERVVPAQLSREKYTSEGNPLGKV